MRRVVSLWLPRFATDRWLRGRWLSSRQQARARPESGSTSGKPAEDSQPLALVADQIGRLTLAAVNDAAAAGGLFPGLPLAEARRLVPGLVTLPLETGGASWRERVCLYGSIPVVDAAVKQNKVKKQTNN